MLKFFTPGFAFAFTLLIFIGCNDNEDSRPSVGFVTTDLQASEEALATKLSFYLDRAATEDIIIDLEFSGSAVRDKDYQCPDQLIIKKGNKLANLTINLLDDGEYERTEETIIITIASVTGDFKIGKKNTATALVAFDAAPHLEVKLDWKAEDETSEVSMNLILFRMDQGEGSLIKASEGIGNQIILLGTVADGTFGLSYHYSKGSCRTLIFRATMKCYNCKLNGNTKPLIFTGTYTNSNLNPSRFVNITQKFVKVGVDYQAFSSLSIPSNGSRGILPE